MPIIPVQTDPTIEKIKNQAAKRPHKNRGYLGASEIGEQCARRLWYSLNGYARKEIRAEWLWAADDGNRCEAVIADRLRDAGVDLVTFNEDGQQNGFSDFDGKYKGHWDGEILGGLLHAPKTQAIWECKLTKQEKFADFQKKKAKFGWKNCLKEWNFVYFIQAQQYMLYRKLNRHYTNVCLAGGRDMDSAYTEFDKEIAEQYRDRAQRIINARSAPPKISEKSDDFRCRICPYSEVCHGKK